VAVSRNRSASGRVAVQDPILPTYENVGGCGDSGLSDALENLYAPYPAAGNQGASPCNDSSWTPPMKSVGAQMDYAKLTIAEIANGISKTEAAIRRCREILDDLQEPKTVGMQAVVKAIRDLLPKLEEDLKALGKAYIRATKRKP